MCLRAQAYNAGSSLEPAVAEHSQCFSHRPRRAGIRWLKTKRKQLIPGEEIIIKRSYSGAHARVASVFQGKYFSYYGQVAKKPKIASGSPTNSKNKTSRHQAHAYGLLRSGCLLRNLRSCIAHIARWIGGIAVGSN